MTVENNQEVICWGCGQSPGLCICESAPQWIQVKPPKEILPFCGGDNRDAQGSGSERIPRSCCRCGKEWVCVRDEWINGTCPHCGASGVTGNGNRQLINQSYKNPIEQKIEFFKNPIKREKPQKSFNMPELSGEKLSPKYLNSSVFYQKPDSPKEHEINPVFREFLEDWLHLYLSGLNFDLSSLQKEDK